MLPRLALAYGPVPAHWRPRGTDAHMVAACRRCGAEYLDDFPYGGILLSPCCVATYLKRYSRAVEPKDLQDLCASPTTAATRTT